MTEVTVVIPTRNRWHLLSTAALPSALGQTDVDVEVVVVDEGSTDETAAALGRVDDSRLRVIRHDRARGVAQARNAGIAHARGEWIAFLDDDDIWAPDKLRRQIDGGRNASFVFSAAAWLDQDRRFQRTLRPPSPAGLADRLLCWNEIWAGCSNVVVRADVLEQVGGFDERLFQLTDWDLWIRLALAAPAAAVDEVLVGYVLQPQSMLLTDRRDVFEEFRYLTAKHRAEATRRNARPSARKFARWVAYGHLRAGRRGRAAATYLRAARHGDGPSVLRAAAALLGERPFRVAQSLRTGRRRPDESSYRGPPWLDAYEV